MKTLEELQTAIEKLQTRAETLIAGAEAKPDTVAEAKALIDTEIQPQLAKLTAEHDAAVQREEVKALQGTVTTLNEAISSLRKPGAGFSLGGTASGKAVADADDPYFDADGTPKRSVFADVRLATRGNSEAIARMAYGIDTFEGKALTSEGKAMTEGTDSQGGYLVRPQLERQLVLARELDNVLRQLCTILPISTTGIQLDQLGLSTTAGWVAELATKPESTGMTVATVTANIFTAAGLATCSNQLLADSNPAIDGLVTTDLTKRLVALEETAFLVGTGTGQPLGLLNTPGLTTTASATAGDPAVAGGLLDNILDSIATVQTAWGQPSAILMHPRTWTRIIKSRNSVGTYTINPQPVAGGGYDPTSPRTYISAPANWLTLFGVPVVLSNRMPTNLGTGTNETRVVVGDFREALILDRQGITIDESPHVYFTSNQTVFRAETRVGFTAARSPVAFNVIGGVGLANG